MLLLCCIRKFGLRQKQYMPVDKEVYYSFSDRLKYIYYVFWPNLSSRSSFYLFVSLRNLEEIRQIQRDTFVSTKGRHWRPQLDFVILCETSKFDSLVIRSHSDLRTVVKEKGSEEFTSVYKTVQKRYCVAPVFKNDPTFSNYCQFVRALDKLVAAVSEGYNLYDLTNLVENFVHHIVQKVQFSCIVLGYHADIANFLFSEPSVYKLARAALVPIPGEDDLEDVPSVNIPAASVTDIDLLLYQDGDIATVKSAARWSEKIEEEDLDLVWENSDLYYFEEEDEPEELSLRRRVGSQESLTSVTAIRPEFSETESDSEGETLKEKSEKLGQRLKRGKKSSFQLNFSHNSNGEGQPIIGELDNWSRSVVFATSVLFSHFMTVFENVPAEIINGCQYPPYFIQPGLKLDFSELEE